MLKDKKDHFHFFTFFTLSPFFERFCGEKLTTKEWSSNLGELARMKNLRRLTKDYDEEKNIDGCILEIKIK